MGSDDGVDGLLATLPDGSRVLSTLFTDQPLPRHVYRFLSKSGTVLREFSTLIELSDFVSRYPASLRVPTEPAS
jgi:hypothetical protein